MPHRALLVLMSALLLPVTWPVRVAHADSGWQWPVAAPHRVVRGFDPPAHDWLPGNRGVDLATLAGEPVFAAGTGTVSFAGIIGGVGVVAVRHAGGLETTYEPLRASVRAGVRVQAGARIGAVTAKGSHCAPAACLHWGLRRGSAYLDPLSLVGGGQVRLLPIMSGAAPAPWLAPAAGGASVGSSAVVLGWAVTATRRRKRRLPPGVASLAEARAARLSTDSAEKRCPLPTPAQLQDQPSPGLPIRHQRQPRLDQPTRVHPDRESRGLRRRIRQPRAPHLRQQRQRRQTRSTPPTNLDQSRLEPDR
jgi:hypothetical protein